MAAAGSVLLHALVVATVLLGVMGGSANVRVLTFTVTEGDYDPLRVGNPVTGVPSIYEGKIKYKGQVVGQVDWTGTVVKDLNKKGGFVIYNAVWTFNKQSKDKKVKVGLLTALGAGRGFANKPFIPDQMNVVGGFGAYESVIGGTIVVSAYANDTYIDAIKLYMLE